MSPWFMTAILNAVFYLGFHHRGNKDCRRGLLNIMLIAVEVFENLRFIIVHFSTIWGYNYYKSKTTVFKLVHVTCT